MAEAKSGNTVRVHYTGTLNDGSQFDSSIGRDPLQITLGQGQVIPGFEEALIGMAPGDNKTVTIGADEAYGPRRDELVHKVEREQIPDEVDCEVGSLLQATAPDGSVLRLQVIESDAESVTLDANHPLAGEDLTFDLEMVEVN